MSTPLSTHDRIKANIAARTAVEELFTFVPDVIRDHRDCDEERFWDLLATMAAAKGGKVLVPDGPQHAMTTNEAQAFEQTKVPWGIYKGEKVIHVPPAYWIKILEGDFALRLKRYVTSQYFKDRQ